MPRARFLSLPIAIWLLFPAYSAQPEPDAREIVRRSVSADNENVLITSRYVYEENELTREFDGSGAVRTTKSERREVFYIGAKQYKRILERNGKPLPPDEARKEKARIDKLSAEAAKLTDAQRQQKFDEDRRQQAKDRERIKAIPDAFDFKLIGTQSLAGRDVFVIEAHPLKNYRGKYDNLLRNTEAKLYIDKQDYEWVRVEADVLDDISIGLFLMKVGKGTRLTFEQTRVNNEVWLPKLVKVKASARALWKKVNIESETTYGNYRKFQSDARIIDSSEIK